MPTVLMNEYWLQQNIAKNWQNKNRTMSEWVEFNGPPDKI